MTTLISLVVFLVVLGLVWWLTTLLPLPAPIAQIIQVLFIILAILCLLGVLTGHMPIPALRL